MVEPGPFHFDTVFNCQFNLEFRGSVLFRNKRDPVTILKISFTFCVNQVTFSGCGTRNAFLIQFVRKLIFGGFFLLFSTFLPNCRWRRNLIFRGLFGRYPKCYFLNKTPLSLGILFTYRAKRVSAKPFVAPLALHVCWPNRAAPNNRWSCPVWPGAHRFGPELPCLAL